jgi:hypothetical protein
MWLDIGIHIREKPIGIESANRRNGCRWIILSGTPCDHDLGSS